MAVARLPGLVIGAGPRRRPMFMGGLLLLAIAIGRGMNDNPASARSAF